MRQSPERRASRFGVRMTLTLVITIAVIGTVQYSLAARALRRRVVAQELTAHQADAVVLKDLHERAPAAEPWESVNELLNHIATRPDVEHVAVIDPGRVVVAVGRRGHGPAADASEHPMPMPMPAARKLGDTVPAGSLRDVLTGGPGFVEIQSEPRKGELRVVVPVDLASGRHVLEIVDSGDTLLKAQDDLRLLLLLTLGIGLPMALPLFYLIGGRSLYARHGAAVERSSRDGLTGLRNHPTFHEDLRREIAAARRHGTELALALVDLDGFKAVNDVRGHRAGDRVLRAVADILESGRPGDTPFRIGGDEFAVVMPMTGAEGAWAAAERLRTSVADADTGVTVSIGLSMLRPDTLGVEQMLDHADAALYRAKSAGRNQVADAAV